MVDRLPRSIPLLIIRNIIWRPPELSELTPMIFDMKLTHLGSEASIYNKISNNTYMKILFAIINVYLLFDEVIFVNKYSLEFDTFLCRFIMNI